MKVNYKQYEKKAEILKVLSHPVRLCIVSGLVKKNSCNVTHMQECLGVSQSSVSQHLQKLRAAGIIEGKRKGTQIEYSIADKNVSKWIMTLLETEEEN